MISIEQASFTYPDGQKAVGNVSLQIKNGETVAIVGANGAGKSTLLMMLVGIAPADEGRILVDGLEIGKKSLTEIRRKIGIVFQNPDEQLFMTRVYDDIAFGPRNYKVEEKEVAQRAANVLQALDITHLRDRAPHKLSSGEKRRVAIASVLAMQPSVLLLDEPTSFLDPRARRHLMKTLSELSLTKLIATHDLDMALTLSDRVIVLKEGAVFADGKPKEILQNEDLLQKCGL